ncbi:MAG: sulfotransferase [Geminicoccaceae bacterium]
MNWAAAAVLSVLVVEIVVRLPLAGLLHKTRRTAELALWTLRARHVSDHWKEQVMVAYAGRMFACSFMLAFWLLLVAAIVTGFVLAVDLPVPGFSSFILGWQGIIATLVAASLYLSLRKHLPRARPKAASSTSSGTSSGTGAYSPLDKFLHRLALQVAPVAELAFDIDQRMAAPAIEQSERQDGPVARRRHVFVAGLARAGTTVLMRRLHGSGAFRSLTYRDMPFVLAPNLWRRISAGNRRDIERAERAHGDRLLVDADSPESFDEVFWRIFSGDEYLEKDELRPHSPADDVTERYMHHVAAVLAAQDDDGRTRYLCKNNNNVLRLASIRTTFPEALILIPVRDPLAQAASLRSQHELFSAMQAEDPFTRSYMTWLGHHEFGLDHRPFRFDGERSTGSAADPASLDYWLDIWARTHEWLDRTAPEGSLFVIYEDLCDDPAVWRHVATAAGIDADNAAGDPFAASHRKPAGEEADPALLRRCMAIHERLRQRARGQMNGTA